MQFLPFIADVKELDIDNHCSPPNIGGFCLDNISAEDCLEFFRFSREEVRLILPFLELDQVTFGGRYRPGAEAAFCLLLFRLAAPNQYKENYHWFGQSRSWQSSVFTDVVHYLVDRYSAKLFWDHSCLTYS
ncbi:hypothetical protein BDZ91DRAFT_833111 [Kalaharituber pfeilii]|nr:hypothetical protein BDZ91DRAFT_833111 [Kalaharituber pfeilii]